MDALEMKLMKMDASKFSKVKESLLLDIKRQAKRTELSFEDLDYVTAAGQNIPAAPAWSNQTDSRGKG